MRGSDARRFDFCVRCLELPGQANTLTEHHTEGRQSHRNQVVFICRRCHDDINRLESQDRPSYDAENEAMLRKTRLLVTSRSLRFVIANRERVAEGFSTGNRNGPSIQVSPRGIEYSGPFGAIGRTGRSYYFVPVSADSTEDDGVDVYDAPDGIGGGGHIGPAAGGWIRFRGEGGGILGSFIAAHGKHTGLVGRLDELRQK
jgi:hypothetical protein